ncbi:MAG: pilus assembly protein PilM [Magnetococcus sp. DMHC-6]
MLSIGKKSIIGLDIGSNAIKAVELKPSGKKWQLHKYGIKSIPQEAIVNSQIKDMEGVARTIRELMAEAHFTSKQVAISVSGSAVIVKKIQVGAMSLLDLEDQIPLEAEEYIPFDIEEVHLDFQVLGQHDEQMDVLLTACKKDLINQRLEAVETAGLQAKICDLDLFCLANSFELILRAPSDIENAMALVNIGASLTNITILIGSDPIFTRDHLFGANLLTKEIQQRYELSYSEAELLQSRAATNQKDNKENNPIPHDYQEEVVRPFFEQLGRQIGQSIDFYKANHPQKPVKAVLISGGGGLTPGLGDFLTEQLGIETRLANPFDGIKLNDSVKKDPILTAMGPRFMIAVGLALRGING